MIESLLRAGELLAARGHDVDDTLLADAVWLAASMVVDDDQREMAEPSDTVDRRPDETRGEAVGKRSEDDDDQNDQTPGDRVDLHSPGPGVGGDQPAKRVTIAGAPAIAQRLEIDWAFRPFRKRRPSPYRVELDEKATVAAICESGVCTVVFRPMLDRWLDVAVVVEQSPTMRIWQETADEFVKAVERGATPRQLKRLDMCEVDDEFRLVNRSGQVTSFRSVVNQGRPTTVFYLTDAVGPGWLTARIPLEISNWSRHALVVVVQVLPPDLWELTSLRLGYPQERQHRQQGIREWNRGVQGLTDIIVCRLEPSLLKQLTHHVTGVAAARVLCLPLDVRCYHDAEFAWPRDLTPTPTPIPADSDAISLYHDFVDHGSPSARRVAEHLASVPDGQQLTLPIMRLIQRTLVDDAAPWQLGEIFLSCLLYRDRSREIEGGEPVYAFPDEIRERLRHDAGPDRRIRTHMLVSQYVESRHGQSPNVDVAMRGESPDGVAESIDESLEPLATVPSSALSEDSSQIVGQLTSSQLIPGQTLGPEERLKAILEITRSLSQAVSPTSLDETLPKVLNSLLRIFVHADQSYIALVTDEGEDLVISWTATRPDSDKKIETRGTFVDMVVKSKEAILSADAFNDERSENPRIRSTICAPLLDGEDHPLGALQVDSFDGIGQFNEDDLQVLVTVASQVGLALTNAQLHDAAMQPKDVPSPEPAHFPGQIPSSRRRNAMRNWSQNAAGRRNCWMRVTRDSYPPAEASGYMLGAVSTACRYRDGAPIEPHYFSHPEISLLHAIRQSKRLQ